MSKSKKNTIDPENIMKIMEQMLQDYLFYQIVHQKKMFNGQRKGLISSFKFIQKLWNLNSKKF